MSTQGEVKMTTKRLVASKPHNLHSWQPTPNRTRLVEGDNTKKTRTEIGEIVSVTQDELNFLHVLIGKLPENIKDESQVAIYNVFRDNSKPGNPVAHTPIDLAYIPLPVYSSHDQRSLEEFVGLSVKVIVDNATNIAIRCELTNIPTLKISTTRQKLERLVELNKNKELFARQDYVAEMEAIINSNNSVQKALESTRVIGSGGGFTQTSLPQPLELATVILPEAHVPTGEVSKDSHDEKKVLRANFVDIVGNKLLNQWKKYNCHKPTEVLTGK